MITVVDESLVAEAKRYRLLYTCESCAMFNPETGKCSLEYPNHEHRTAPLQVGGQLVFCKEFEAR